MRKCASFTHIGPMPTHSIQTLFPTRIYRAKMPAARATSLNAELEDAIYSLAEDDGAGRDWCEANGYPGYTSYASLDDLAWRMPPFAELAEHLNAHAGAFAKELQFDLGGGALVLDSLWVNLLMPGGMHSGHIHPHAVLSGTYYVSVPDGASSIRFEDPRLAMMMAAPPKKKSARQDNQPFATIAPKAGALLLWESWLRHEVLANQADAPRLSVSFNFAWT